VNLGLAENVSNGDSTNRMILINAFCRLWCTPRWKNSWIRRYELSIVPFYPAYYWSKHLDTSWFSFIDLWWRLFRESKIERGYMPFLE
jgi:hypothetical protein